MEIKIKRSDKQYTDVESFEEYELTHCLGYEMAIRNIEVIKTIKQFLLDYINYDRYIETPILDTSSFKKAEKSSQKLLDLFINPFSLYIDYHFFDSVNQEIAKIKLEDDSEEFCTNPISLLLFSPSSEKYYSGTRSNNTTYEHKTTELYTSFMVHLEDTNTKSKTLTRNDIEPNYCRPLTIPTALKKEKNIILNLNLPKKELISFIEKLKNEYDKTYTSIKTVDELLGETVKQTDYKIKYKDEQFDPRNIFSSPKKVADMLFLYDCKKLGYSNSIIKNEIYNYNADNGVTTKTLDDKTLARYLSILTEYIDDKKYQELVTGKDNKN